MTILADLSSALLAVAGIDVADGHELDARLALGPFHDACALAAHADRRHHDLIVGASLGGTLRGGVVLFLIGKDLAGVPGGKTRADCKGRQGTIHEPTAREASTFHFHRFSPERPKAKLVT